MAFISPVFFLVCAAILPLLFAMTEVRAADWADLSLEQLMNTEVTAVSSSEQNFSDTAAAVFIITQEDIRRSGATQIPELLRMVPGLQVARISASKWAVGIRGFNSRFTDNLLVMIDQQVVYTPSFSGTYWENHDLVLEDIDRIEVVRGSGASIWGTNAVNGVISILTKSSDKTSNGLLSVTMGDEEQLAAVRYGGEWGQNGHYRAYLKHSNRDAQTDALGRDADDDWNTTRVGFRTDWQGWNKDQVVIMGHMYRSDIRQNYNLPDASGRVNQRNLATGDAYGGSLQGRWQHDFSLSSRTTTQLNYQHFRRKDTAQDELRNTLDFDFRHELALLQHHQLIWGIGYRVGWDQAYETAILSTANPESKTLHLFSLFAQDRIQLFNNQLELTVGSRIHYHTFDDWQVQPNLRLLWKPGRYHRFWVSASQSSQTPSRAKRDAILKPFKLSLGLNFDLVTTNNPQLDADKVFTFEVGYRTWAVDTLFMDLTLYYAAYTQFPVLQASQVNLQAQRVSLNWRNNGKAQAWGLEYAMDWRPTNDLKFQLAYNFIHYDVRVREDPFNIFEFSIFPNGEIAPKQQASLRVSWDILPQLALDLGFRYVDSIILGTQLPEFFRGIDSYTSINVRLAWNPAKNLEIALIGRNLNQPQHPEFLEEFGTFPEQIERSVSGQLRWHF